MERLEELMKTVKAQEALGIAKANDLLNAVKAKELMCLKKEEKKNKVCRTCAWIAGIVIGVAVIAAIAYGLYCYFTPDYLEDFEDDFDEELEDDFDEEFFDEEDEPEADEKKDKEK